MKDSSSADRDQAIRPQQVQRGSSTDVIWIDNDLLPIEREREREGGGETTDRSPSILVDREVCSSRSLAFNALTGIVSISRQARDTRRGRETDANRPRGHSPFWLGNSPVARDEARPVKAIRKISDADESNGSGSDGYGNELMLRNYTERPRSHR